MKQEDIIRMAREVNNGKVRVWEDCHLLYPDELARFAALVAAAENEACAKVCEDSVEYAGDTLAQAIRARG
jgi:hypothetical protein